MKKVFIGILLVSTMSIFGCRAFQKNYLVPELLPKEENIAKQLEAIYLSYEDSEVDGKPVTSKVKEYCTQLERATGGATVNTLKPLSSEQKEYFRQKRNNILSNLTLLMDIRYRQYERAFYNVGATAGSAFDIAVLGMTAAGSVSGGAATKSILSAIAAGLTGTRLALEKNFLYEQTSPILIKQMQKLRKDKLAEIDKKMADNIDTYPLERGLIDIAEYFYSGTIVSALQSMTEKLSQKTADQEIDNFIKLRDKLYGAMESKVSVANEALGIIDKAYSSGEETDEKDKEKKGIFDNAAKAINSNYTTFEDLKKSSPPADTIKKYLEALLVSKDKLSTETLALLLKAKEALEK